MAPFASVLPYLHATSGWMDDRSYRDGKHEGVDFRVAVGVPVSAAESGQVSHVQATPNGKPAGVYVAIRHAGGLRTRYMHLSRADVVKGQVVAAGQLIGRSGASGTDGMNSTTPHLHFDTQGTAEARDNYIVQFGTPRGGFPSKGADLYALPSEALLPIDKYEDRVKRAAARNGVVLGHAGVGVLPWLVAGGVAYWIYRS